jgi:hypothetical protein
MKKHLSFAFICILLFFSCSKDNTLNTDTLGINGFSQVVFLLNGQPVVKKYGNDSSNAYSSSSVQINDTTYNFTFAATYNINATDSFSIAMGTIQSDSAVSVPDGEFDDFISSGSKDFAPLAENKTLETNGVEITYIQNGITWSSTTNSGPNQYSINQDGSSFTIDNAEPVENFLGHHTVKITGHFNCTLYQANQPADTMQIQDASFVAFYTND